MVSIDLYFSDNSQLIGWRKVQNQGARESFNLFFDQLNGQGHSGQFSRTIEFIAISAYGSMTLFGNRAQLTLNRT